MKMKNLKVEAKKQANWSENDTLHNYKTDRLDYSLFFQVWKQETQVRVFDT